MVKNNTNFKRCEKEVKLILNDLLLINNLKLNKEFQDNVLKVISIMFLLSKSSKANKAIATALLNNFNTKIEKNLEYDKKLSYKNEGDMVDDINYLQVYVKNAFHYDIKNNKRIDNVDSSISNFNEKEKAIVNVMEGIGTDNKVIANTFLAGFDAQKKLSNDIKTGKIYIYKSRPKIIYATRIVLFFTNILFTISCVLLAISFFMLNDFSGVMFVLMSLFFGYEVYKDIGVFKTKNPNFLYFIKWSNYVFTFICYAIIFCISFFVSDDVIGNSPFSAMISHLDKYDYIIMLVGFISFLVSDFLLLFVIILGRFFNPVADMSLIEEKTRTYTMDSVIEATGDVTKVDKKH